MASIHEDIDHLSATQVNSALLKQGLSTSRGSTINKPTDNPTKSMSADFTGFTEMESECEELDEDICSEKVNILDFTTFHFVKESSRTNSKENIHFGITDDQKQEFRPSLLSSKTVSLNSLESNVSSSKNSQTDFFENLGSVPDVENVSCITLRGKFVDPLTGTNESNEVLLVVSNYEVDAPVQETLSLDKESSMIVLEEFSFEDYDKRYPEDTIEEEIEEDKSIGKNFTIIPTLSLTHVQANKSSETIKDNASLAVQGFLNDLIKETIKISHQEKNATDTRRLLSKNKLARDLVETMMESYVERKVNSFLDRKVVEYSRRKGLKRNIEEDNPETDFPEMSSYKAKCQELDRLLGTEFEIMRKVNVKAQSLKEQLKYLKRKQTTIQLNFVNMVRKAFKCNSRPKLASVVDLELAHMRKLKKEISQTRSDVIHHLHTLSSLQEQIKKVKNIGDGRNVGDFELLYGKTAALYKKIEDRQTELNKMHERFQVNLHMMAHSQLKRESIVRLTKAKKNTLSNLQEEERSCREHLFRAQKKRKHTRNQLKELSLQCGLLDKPVLMLDFDETIELLKKKKDQVDQLRKIHMELIGKLQQQEKSESSTKKISNASENKSNPKNPKNEQNPISSDWICLNF